MSCHDAQTKLSFYLYGELDFAEEEAVEQHLAECAFCQQALAREKTWHTAASAGYRDVPLDLLAECREDLRHTLRAEAAAESPRRRFSFDWGSLFRITPNRWSYQLALGSFLVFLGFAGGRLVNRMPDLNFGSGPNTASLLGGAHIRDIQPSGDGQVRILVDHVDQREVVGTLRDENVKRWVLAAVQDPNDPGIRVDSVEILANDGGNDVRDALLDRVEHDPNAAVRLKALEALQHFSDDPVTRNAIVSVLQRDSEPALRAAAVDVLASANGKLVLTPEAAATLRQLARSERDDYLRLRCLQILQADHDAFGIY
ncbi:MAG TPA: HEAT repeat domain-containing protein [Bryobacteraceae bacterium]|jgi:hypothetical protein|nr:HEAT repeat domain-containing protein [Bryobacteraceae bacterium]